MIVHPVAPPSDPACLGLPVATEQESTRTIDPQLYLIARTGIRGEQWCHPMYWRTWSYLACVHEE